MIAHIHDGKRESQVLVSTNDCEADVTIQPMQRVNNSSSFSGPLILPFLVSFLSFSIHFFVLSRALGLLCRLHLLTNSMKDIA